MVRSTRLLAIAFYVLGVLSFSADYIVERAGAGSSDNRLVSWMTSTTFRYRTFARAGYRKPRTQLIRLVTRERAKEPDEVFNVVGTTDRQNICHQRALMAKLISKLTRAAAGAIVIDKYFAPSTIPCATDNDSTRDLQASIEAAADKLPVVVSENDSSASQLKAAQEGILTEGQTKAFEKADVIVFPTLEFKGKHLKTGLLTLNGDTSKIPLTWKAQTNSSAGQSEPQRSPSLALSAASAYDAHLLDSKAFSQLYMEMRQPFTGLLSEKEIPKYSAIDLVCNHKYVKRTNWEQDCSGGSYKGDDGDYAIGDLRSHVVVIGEYRGMDNHDSDIGVVPGVLLQANYIESLLDDRYFRPVPQWVQILIALLWFACVWLVFERCHSLIRAVVYSGAISVVLWWLLFYFLVEQWGYYLVVSAPGVFLILGTVVDGFVEKLKASKEKNDVKTQTVSNC